MIPSLLILAALGAVIVSALVTSPLAAAACATAAAVAGLILGYGIGRAPRPDSEDPFGESTTNVGTDI